ncbi:MAG: hypothetical protein IIU46_09170 [Treponema sp.]|nr:hypothetical protein [Treponema sp.]
MKHDCEYYMNMYLSLDRGERLPYRLSSHVLNCPSCRKEIEHLVHAEKVASEPLKLPADADLAMVRKIVSQIDTGRKPKKHKVSLGTWIFFGIFLVLAILIFGTLSLKSKPLVFVFYVSAAMALVTYSFAFFAYNLDYFIKRLHMKIAS